MRNGFCHVGDYDVTSVCGCPKERGDRVFVLRRRVRLDKEMDAPEHGKHPEVRLREHPR